MSSSSRGKKCIVAFHPSWCLALKCEFRRRRPGASAAVDWPPPTSRRLRRSAPPAHVCRCSRSRHAWRRCERSRSGFGFGLRGPREQRDHEHGRHHDLRRCRQLPHPRYHGFRLGHAHRNEPRRRLCHGTSKNRSRDRLWRRGGDTRHADRERARRAATTGGRVQGETHSRSPAHWSSTRTATQTPCSSSKHPARSSPAAASAVTVLGGGAACSVTWQIGSSAALGADSQLIGSVFAFTSITARARATTGRLLAQGAAVTLTATPSQRSPAIHPPTTTEPATSTTESPTAEPPTTTTRAHQTDHA